MTAKYLVVRFGGEEVPFVWPTMAGVLHAAVEARLRSIGAEPVSAGFVAPRLNWQCFGESLSLDLCSRGEPDTALLRRVFGELPPPVAAPAQSQIENPPSKIE